MSTQRILLSLGTEDGNPGSVPGRGVHSRNCGPGSMAQSWEVQVKVVNAWCFREGQNAQLGKPHLGTPLFLIGIESDLEMTLIKEPPR